MLWPYLSQRQKPANNNNNKTKIVYCKTFETRKIHKSFFGPRLALAEQKKQTKKTKRKKKISNVQNSLYLQINVSTNRNSKTKSKQT